MRISIYETEYVFGRRDDAPAVQASTGAVLARPLPFPDLVRGGRRGHQDFRERPNEQRPLQPYRGTGGAR